MALILKSRAALFLIPVLLLKLFWSCRTAARPFRWTVTRCVLLFSLFKFPKNVQSLFLAKWISDISSNIKTSCGDRNIFNYLATISYLVLANSITVTSKIIARTIEASRLRNRISSCYSHLLSPPKGKQREKKVRKWWFSISSSTHSWGKAMETPCLNQVEKMIPWKPNKNNNVLLHVYPRPGSP